MYEALSICKMTMALIQFYYFAPIVLLIEHIARLFPVNRGGEDFLRTKH